MRNIRVAAAQLGDELVDPVDGDSGHLVDTGAHERLRRTSHADPDRQRVLDRSGVDALADQGRPVPTGPGHLFLVADLQEQLILRVPSHRPVQEGHLAAGALELLEQHHELDVVARQTVGIGDQQPVHLARPYRVA